MKKRHLILLIVALILCLAGCGECEHEWTEADCLTAKTCTKCSVTEGDPLGHDFAPAECEIPETCTRCAITQGAALDHALSEWEFSGNYMTRNCEKCNFKEKTDIDRELYFWRNIAGHWDPVHIVYDGKTTPASMLDNSSVQYCLRITEDKKITVDFKGDRLEGTLSFQSYQNSANTHTYYFEADFGEDGPVSFAWTEESTDSAIQMYLNDKESITFSKNDIIVDYVQGVWASADNKQILILSLNQDGTFVCNGEYTGTWHVLPARQEEGKNYKSCPVLLNCMIDDECITSSMEVYLGDPSWSLEEYLYAYGNQAASAIISYDEMIFHTTKTDMETAEKLKATEIEGKSKFIGVWNSRFAYNFGSNSWTVPKKIVTEYEIEFKEDGTFQTNLESVYSGTWECTNLNAVGSKITYSLSIEYDRYPNSDYSTEYTDGEGLSLLIPDTDIVIHFYKGPSPWEEEATEALVGSWDSVSVEEWKERKPFYEIVSSKEEKNYSAVFRKDGTFTTYLNGEKSGRWFFTSEFINGEYLIYNFTAQFSGEDQAFDGGITLKGDELIDMSFTLHEESGIYDYVFVKHE